MVYVTGSLAFDFIMDYPGKFSEQIIPDKIHQINISFLVNTLSENRGGTSGNIAYNLALLKVPVSIVACVGRDFESYKDFLLKASVGCSYIKIIEDLYTARAFITTDLVDNQITGFYPGALSRDKELKLPFGAGTSDFVIVAPTDPAAMDSFVNQCIERSIPFMFDFGMQMPRLSVGTLKAGIDNAVIVIGNDYEMELLMQKSNLKSQSDRAKFKNKKKDQLWVTTLGEKGCVIERNSKKIYVPAAKPEKIIDPTGAGDAFRAAFLTAFLQGKSLVECGRMGNLCAVYTVEKFGTTTHTFTVSAFKKRYEESYREKLIINTNYE